MPNGNVSNLETLLLALPENGSLVALANGYMVKLDREDNTTFNLDLMNACGQSSVSQYDVEGSGETVTIKGDYTCVESGPLEILDAVASDLNSDLQNLTVQDRDVVDNIDWHDIVLNVEY